MSERVFNRLEEFDERSRNFKLTTMYRAPRSYTWSCGKVLDQGSEGSCVGHGWAHDLIARPVVVPNIDHFSAVEIYKRARNLDQWPGDNYDGTSVIAGAKAVLELGLIERYEWTFSLNEALVGISYRGPAVIGIPWYESMNSPDADGKIRVRGRLQGGHCILANGYNVKTQLVRLHNSWGPGWGKNGECFIHADDFWRLLDEGGECCLPIGRKQRV